MGLLYLSQPVEFEPVSQLSSVFYDEQRGSVISVRGGGVTGVTVKSLQECLLTARLQTNTDLPIISIKLSPNLATLSIQRGRHTVSFLPVTALASDVQSEYSQTTRAKNSALLGFVWLSNTELVYITEAGLEVFTICQERRTVKYSRSAGESLAWYCVSGSHLVTSSQVNTHSLTVWSLRGGNITKLTSLALQHSVTDKEVRLINVYLSVFISVTVGNQIQLYIINNDTVSLSHILTEVDTGTIGLQTLDNLILVHSLSLSRTKLYDIKISVTEAGEPLSVSPSLPVTSITKDGSSVSYSPNWVLFLPNVLVDARNGRMMSVNMKLTNNLSNIPDQNIVNTARFLINRQHGKTPLINLLKRCVADQVCLDSLQQMLGCVVTAYTRHQLHLSHNPDLTTCTVRRTSGPLLDFPPSVVLDQPDIFTNVLNTFTDRSEVPEKFLLAVVVEYVLCLLEHSLVPRQFLQELLINLCVRTGRLYQLQQYLQYHVITDSKPLACLLLSLEKLHPPSRQMALDMMSRLGTATNEITEILLDNGNIVTALNFVTANGGADCVPARKFLEAAERTGDKMTFYNVFTFLQERNVRLKGAPAFSPKDQCETFVNKFKEMFLLNESTTS